MVSNFRALDDLPVAPADATPSWSKTELKRRQVAANLTLEDLELILAPMVEDAKEAVGSMGQDTPLAVISDKPRTVSHFFRQTFSQVTNPPIDSLHDRYVMIPTPHFSSFPTLLAVLYRNEEGLVP